MHKISIKNETDDSIIPTHVSIDGKPVRAVSVNFNQAVDAVPTCEIEINALPDIEALADIQFAFMPQTIQESAKVLRYTLINDKEFYNAFSESIASALKEIPAETGLYDVAKAVADRIIGEE